MKKRAYVTGTELTDEQWSKLEPLLPPPSQSSKGGQICAPNRACLEGILWILRNDARWKDMPERFLSESACWRHMREWNEKDIRIDVWHTLLAILDARGRLDWEEVFGNGTFSPTKRAAAVGKAKRGKRKKVMAATDGQGIQTGIRAFSATPHESKLIEVTLNAIRAPRLKGGRPRISIPRLIYERAADSAPLRMRLKKQASI